MLSTTTFAVYSEYHINIQVTPGYLFFGMYLIPNMSNILNCIIITGRKKQLINKTTKEIVKG